jgi:putative membrane protein
MKQASRLFSEGEKKAISAAVAEAEASTSGEIVPVVATACGRYDRAEDIVGLLSGLLVLAAGWLFCPYVHPDACWGSGALLSSTGLIPALVCVLAGFIAGSALATRIPALRLPFIPAREMDEEVQRAAWAAFAEFRLRRTRDSTGILIFASLYERRVVVIADDGVAKRTGQGTWEDVRDRVIDGLRRNEPAEGLKAGIQKCGEILAKHCRREADDRNELSNELRLIDSP